MARNVYQFESQTSLRMEAFGDLTAAAMIIMKWMIYKYDARMWIGIFWLRMRGPVLCSCGHDSEPSNIIFA
jgi:hypothetical protein